MRQTIKDRQTKAALSGMKHGYARLYAGLSDRGGFGKKFENSDSGMVLAIWGGGGSHGVCERVMSIAKSEKKKKKKENPNDVQSFG